MIEIKDVQEFALQISQSHTNVFAAILNELPDLIFIKDVDSNFVYSNHAHLEILGQTLERIKGKSDFDFFPEALAHLYFKDESEMFESGIPVIKVEQTLLPEGTYIWLSTIKVPIQNPEGYPVGLIGISRRIPDPLSTQSVDQTKDQIQAILTRSMNSGKDIERLRALQSDVFGMLDIISQKLNLFVNGVPMPESDDELRQTTKIQPFKNLPKT